MNKKTDKYLCVILCILVFTNQTLANQLKDHSFFPTPKI